MDKEEYIQMNKVFFEKWAKVYNFIEIAIKGVENIYPILYLIVQAWKS